MQSKPSKQHLDAIVDSIFDPLLVISKDYQILYMNNAAQKMYGHAISESGEHYCYKVTHNVESSCREQGEQCPVYNVFETGEPSKVVHKHIKNGGIEEMHEVSAAPVFDENGKVVEVVEIVRDVTKNILYQQLEISEQKYRSLISSSPRAIITFKSDGEIIDFNPGAQTMFGHEAESALGKSFLMLIPERLHSVYADDLKEADDSKKYKYVGKTTETYGLNGAGEEFPISVTLSTWDSEEEHFYCAIVEDLSRRKNLEQAFQNEKVQLEDAQSELLKKHEEMHRIFKHVESAKREWEQSMDCISDVVIVTNENNEILRANKPILTIIEKPFLEILGRKWNELFLENGISKSGEFEGEVEFFHKSLKSYFTVRIHKVATSASESAQAVTLHDITERKLITKELEQKNTELRSHRENLQQALDELTLLIKKVIIEKDFGTYFTLPPNLEQCWKAMKCEEKSCPCYGKEAMMCWQEAGTFCKGQVQGRFAEKYGDCAQCKHYQESISDPTYQIGLQFNNMMKVLENKNNELEKAYSELKATQSQILQQEKMASIGQLAAGVAHEINNPVGFITSNIGSLAKYVDKLKEYINAQSKVIEDYENFLATDELEAMRKKLKIDFVLEDVKDLVAESLDGTDRVKKIVQNLKNFSRVDQSEHVNADLNECVESTLNIVWNELKYKTTVNKEYGEIPLTYCYPQQLNQVFMNLLVNGAQAIKEKGDIGIKTWSDTGSIYVSISDTGSGIPEENLNNLFEPFFTTKEVGKGTGLGLSIAYDIVTKKHDGELLVESEVGKGTTFTVKIPVIKREKDE